MCKENVLIKADGKVEHVLGCYGIYYKRIKEEIMLYVGSGDIADCYNRHDSMIKYGYYAGNNKDIIHQLFAKGEKLYFKMIEFCNEDNVNERETYWIDFYKDTVCNGNSRGKRRSNKPTPEETERRRIANSGENNPRARLSDKEIEELRRLIDSKEYRDIELAKMFNISISYVSAIRHNHKRKKTDTLAM